MEMVAEKIELVANKELMPIHVLLSLKLELPSKQRGRSRAVLHTDKDAAQVGPTRVDCQVKKLRQLGTQKLRVFIVVIILLGN